MRKNADELHFNDTDLLVRLDECRDVRFYAWIPGWGLLLAFPFYVLSLLQREWPLGKRAFPRRLRVSRMEKLPGNRARIQTREYRFNERVRDRDYFLVDEERGLVMCRAFIDHKGVMDEYPLTDGAAFSSVQADFISRFEPLGLAPAQYAILTLVERNPGCRQGDIGKALGVTYTNLAQRVEALVDSSRRSVIKFPGICAVHRA